MMKKSNLVGLILLFCLTGWAQTVKQYRNVFTIERSSQENFTSLMLLTGCPETNEYQEVSGIDEAANKHWKKKEIDENGNHYLELDLNEYQLSGLPRDFNVSYVFRHLPKRIQIDFSSLKNPDGSWKEMPPYDTKSADYRDNIGKSGSFIVPGNKEIKSLSKQLMTESNGNLLDYAERCYLYVAAHYKYLNPNTGLHPLSKLLKDGGGDCANLSSIYISLLRAQGIPARHVQAIGVSKYHIWSEFYIQDFGWVPVDVTYKNSNPREDFFGRYNSDWVVVQKGVNMQYSTSVGRKTAVLLQQYYYWFTYSNSDSETMSIEHHLEAAGR